MLPVLCPVILPGWLLVFRAPQTVVEHPVEERWLHRSAGFTSKG